jgi:hypothetical protein
MPDQTPLITTQAATVPSDAPQVTPDQVNLAQAAQLNPAQVTPAQVPEEQDWGDCECGGNCWIDGSSLFD